VGMWVNRSARRAAAAGSEDGSHDTAPRKVAIPWVALGFPACVVINSLHVLPDTATSTLTMLDTFALTMAMTALGIETRIAQIRQAGPRALTTGLILYVWLFFGGL